MKADCPGSTPEYGGGGGAATATEGVRATKNAKADVTATLPSPGAHTERTEHDRSIEDVDVDAIVTVRTSSVEGICREYVRLALKCSSGTLRQAPYQVATMFHHFTIV
jgi:hypothetical protein